MSAVIEFIQAHPIAIAAPILAAAIFAIVAALASGIPEAQRDDDLFFTPEERAEHDAAWDLHMTTETPIHDQLAVETFRDELDNGRTA